MKKLIDKDVAARTYGKFHSFAGEEFAVESRQDVEPVLDHVQKLREIHDDSFKGDGPHMVASVPLNIWMKWEREGITQDDDLLMKKLNDPKFRKLRVKQGKV